MKAIALTLLVALVLCFSAAAAPGIRIDQAASIAQGQLTERGLTNRVHIVSIAIEAQAIAKPVKYWYARWSETIAIDDTKRELGLRINMDGSLVRVVEGSNASGSSAGREALRNHRTRSDRPSILDLKH